MLGLCALDEGSTVSATCPRCSTCSWDCRGPSESALQADATRTQVGPGKRVVELRDE